jgi:hypothetical protein
MTNQSLGRWSDDDAQMHEAQMHEAQMHEAQMQDAAHQDVHLQDADNQLTIDCSTCLARPAACGDCIVSVLLGPIEHVGTQERLAFAVLADSGLVPPLRLVTGDQGVA